VGKKAREREGTWAAPRTRGPTEEKEKNGPAQKEQEGFQFIQINFN
jgi:hypothetical protein